MNDRFAAESADNADAITAPGAARSGFWAPPRKGPGLEKGEMASASNENPRAWPSVSVQSDRVVNDATVTARPAAPGDPIFISALALSRN
jgi:hypothetical protein